MMITVKKLLIIKHINCVHDLHLKPVPHSVAVSIQETASLLNANKAHNVTNLGKITMQLLRSMNIQMPMF